MDLHQRPPANPSDLVLPPVQTREAFAQLAANEAAMMLMQSSQQSGGYAAGTIISAIHTTLYPIWTYMKASEVSAPNVFAVRDSLVEKLLNTDIDNVLPEDVRLPFPGFYVSLPFGEKLLMLRNHQTGMHEASFVGIAEGWVGEERGLFCTLWGEPRPDGSDAHDDHIYSFSFQLPKAATESSLRELLEANDEIQRAHMRDAGIPLLIKRDVARVYDQSFDFYDAISLLRRFVINFCLYLNSPNPDIEPAKSGQRTWGQIVAGESEQKRTKVRVSKSRRTSKKPSATTVYTIWDVGRNIEQLKRVSSATDILVRGHFRRQAHGVGRRLRKVIWIEPHIRLSTGEEVAGHEYDVEPNREHS
jgi:hypothetical protein